MVQLILFLNTREKYLVYFPRMSLQSKLQNSHFLEIEELCTRKSAYFFV